MQQYYIGKQEGNIDEIEENENYDGLMFLNNGFDRNKQYEHINFNRCTFSMVSFLKCKLENVKFEHCIFVECYFKKSELNQIKYSNCKFICCVFSGIKMVNCEFFYTEWEKSYIKYNEIIGCMPKKSNYRRRLCKVMARNCLDDGNIDEYRKFFFEEKEAAENKYLDIVFMRDEYNTQNYKFYDRIRYVIKYIGSIINKKIWGYGEKISNILVTCLLVISIFTLCFLPTQTIDNNTSIEQFGSKIFNSIYVSVCNFFGLSCEIALEEMGWRYLAIFEGAIGIALMGILVAALFRRINPR